MLASGSVCEYDLDNNESEECNTLKHFGENPPLIALHDVVDHRQGGLDYVEGADYQV